MVLNIEVHFQSSSYLGIAWISLTIERRDASSHINMILDDKFCQAAEEDFGKDLW